MTEKKKLILHIGLPKTATTSLQDNVFKVLHDRGMLSTIREGKNKLYNYSGEAGLLKYALGDGNPSSAKVHLESNMPNIFSQEVLTCPSDFHRMRIDSKYKDDVNPLILKELFADCDVKVVLSLRNSMDYIPSYYLQNFWLYKNEEQYNTSQKFLNYVKDKPEKHTVFFFDKLIALYEDVFGAENVKVLFYEDLRYNKQLYYKQWADILEVDESLVQELMEVKKQNKKAKVEGGVVVTNRTVTPVSKVIRFVKRSSLLRSFAESNLWKDTLLQKNLEKLVFKEKRQFVPNFTEEEKQDIFNYYRDHNMNLIGKHGITREKLERYGYI